MPSHTMHSDRVDKILDGICPDTSIKALCFTLVAMTRDIVSSLDRLNESLNKEEEKDG